MVTHILDTNICIYLIKKHPPRVFEKFTLFSTKSIGISSISVAELMYGVSKSDNPEKNLDALEDFLEPLNILDFDYNAAAEYGPIKNRLFKMGTPISPFDMLIEAHAKSLNLILVSNNLKEFNRVEGLLTENWV